VDANGIDHSPGLAGGIEMGERHLHGLAIGGERAVQPALVGGGFGETQPVLAPENAGQFFEMLLSPEAGPTSDGR
jgi:hypothetical protein